jgi:hypothetical protein
VSGGPAPLPAWEQLACKVPGVTGPMRRCLEQIACVLRPRSVVNADMVLRCFAGFLAAAAPEVTAWPKSPAVTSRHSSPGWRSGLARTSRP